LILEAGPAWEYLTHGWQLLSLKLQPLILEAAAALEYLTQRWQLF